GLLMIRVPRASGARAAATADACTRPVASSGASARPSSSPDALACVWPWRTTISTTPTLASTGDAARQLTGTKERGAGAGIVETEAAPSPNDGGDPDHLQDE